MSVTTRSQARGPRPLDLADDFPDLPPSAAGSPEGLPHQHGIGGSFDPSSLSPTARVLDSQFSQDDSLQAEAPRSSVPSPAITSPRNMDAASLDDALFEILMAEKTRRAAIRPKEESLVPPTFSASFAAPQPAADFLPAEAVLPDLPVDPRAGQPSARPSSALPADDSSDYTRQPAPVLDVRFDQVRIGTGAYRHPHAAKPAHGRDFHAGGGGQGAGPRQYMDSRVRDPDRAAGGQWTREPRPLSSSICESVKCDLVAVNVQPFIDVLKSQLVANNPATHVIVFGTDVEYQDYMATDPAASMVDRWAAAQILACISRDKTHRHSLLVYDNLIRDSVCIASGRASIDMIIKVSAGDGGLAEMLRIASFNEKIFYTPGMSQVDALIASRAIEAEFNSLPAHARGAPAGLQLSMIDKLPKSNLFQEHAYKMRIKVLDDLARGLPPIPTDQLALIIATRLKEGTRESAYAAGRGSPPGQNPPRTCFNCGDANHAFRDCTAECAKCKLSFCPGVRGEACVVVEPTPPLANTIKNAHGRLLPRPLLVVVNKARVAAKLAPIVFSEEARLCEELDGDDYDSEFAGLACVGTDSPKDDAGIYFSF